MVLLKSHVDITTTLPAELLLLLGLGRPAPQISSDQHSSWNGLFPLAPSYLFRFFAASPFVRLSVVCYVKGDRETKERKNKKSCFAVFWLVDW